MPRRLDGATVPAPAPTAGPRAGGHGYGRTAHWPGHGRAGGAQRPEPSGRLERARRRAYLGANFCRGYLTGAGGQPHARSLARSAIGPAAPCLPSFPSLRMKNLVRVLLLLAALLLGPPARAQDLQTRRELDSLRRQLAAALPDSNRVKLLNALAFKHAFSKPDSAFRLAQQAQQLARRLAFAPGEARALNVMGASLLTLGDLPKALRYFQQSLTSYRVQRDLLGQHSALSNIGIVYDEQRRYGQALLTTQEASRLLTRAYPDPAGHERDYAIMNNNIGDSYQKLEQLDSADRYLQRALRFATAPTARDVAGTVLGSLGQVQNKRGNRARALALYRRAVTAARDVGDDALASAVCLNMALVYQTISRLDSSRALALRALRQAQGAGYPAGVLPAGQLLAQLYRGRDDARALEYYEVAVAAKDSLFSQQKIKQLLTLGFEEQQRRQELAAARAAYRARLRLYGLGGAGAAALAVAALLWRGNRRQYRANAALNRLNQAVTAQKGELQAQRDQLDASLTALRATQTQLIQKEKMASLGELTAGIAHEIQNPLNFVNNFAEVSGELVAELEQEQARPERDPALEAELLGDLKQNLGKIGRHGRRAAGIVRGMLEHSSASTGERRPTDLNRLCEEYLRLAYQGLQAKDNSFNAKLTTDFAPGLPKALVVGADVGRVLLNLFTNAFYAVRQRQLTGEPGYQPTVSVSTQRVNGQVEIRVRDNGTGMSAEVQAKIFQPFFTTKPAGEGTGLGLSLAYDIVVQGHEGTLTVESQPGEFTEFTLLLPDSAEQPAAAGPA